MFRKIFPFLCPQARPPQATGSSPNEAACPPTKGRAPAGPGRLSAASRASGGGSGTSRGGRARKQEGRCQRLQNILQHPVGRPGRPPILLSAAAAKPPGQAESLSGARPALGHLSPAGRRCAKSPKPGRSWVPRGGLRGRSRKGGRREGAGPRVPALLCMGGGCVLRCGQPQVPSERPACGQAESSWGRGPPVSAVANSAGRSRRPPLPPSHHDVPPAVQGQVVRAGEAAVAV